MTPITANFFYKKSCVSQKFFYSIKFIYFFNFEIKFLLICISFITPSNIINRLYKNQIEKKFFFLELIIFEIYKSRESHFSIFKN